jgi:nucleotide-binding universal stress UspA family protein
VVSDGYSSNGVLVYNARATLANSGLVMSTPGELSLLVKRSSMLYETYPYKPCAVPRFALGSRVRHILVPTDLTARCKASVACAVQLARRLPARLTLLYVWPGCGQADIPFSPLYAAQLESDGRRVIEESQKAESSLRSLRNRIRLQHSLSEDCFLLGDPGPLILRVASECDVDLMVISAHHCNWLDCLFDEGGSDRIIRDAPCSVLVVPSTEHEKLAAAPDSPLKARRLETGLAWAKE